MLNGKTYIGQTKAEGHALARYMGSGILIRRAIQKYGEEHFFKDILIKDIKTKKVADIFEMIMIGSCSPEYNISEGGQGGNLGKAWIDERRQFWASDRGKELQRKGAEASSRVLKEKWKDEDFRKKQSEIRSINGKGNQNGNKTVRCITTNETFGSVTEAANHFSVSRQNLSNRIRDNLGKIVKKGALKGLAFEYVH